MLSLIRFELEKIWREKSFILSICILFLVNLFLLWYTNLSDEYSPALRSYRAVQKELRGKSEAEKKDYIVSLKEEIDGVSFVQEILRLQSKSKEKGNTLAEQSMKNNPGVFETYYESYKSGEYLRFTDSLEKEAALVDELYREWEKVAGYNEYLNSVQEIENSLSGISVFGKQEEDSFSLRNIRKSAEDYRNLSSKDICFTMSKLVTASMESEWTDILLILGVFLFLGGLIISEKEKKLFYITRSTKYGIGHDMLAKLFALFINCMFLTGLFYGINLLYISYTAGSYNLLASIQSLASYMESSLSISILEYILLSVFTKGMILFGVGVIITVFCIISNNIIFPYFVGIGLCGISWIIYTLVPAGSDMGIIKYMNIVGFLRTESLYGGYLNLNVMEYPISRLSLSWIILVLLIAAGILASMICFSRGNNLELRNERSWLSIPFSPHANLMKHEWYKIMVTNHGIYILILFGVLLGYRDLNKQYNPSIYEQYYRDMMLQLEGELSSEKESMIHTEQKRYKTAFKKIEQIDTMVSEGEIDEGVGNTLKAEWESIIAFYPSFQRIEKQYEKICMQGGDFIYDTGYLYLFGKMDNVFLIDITILTFGLILAFGNAISMEDQSGTWKLLGTTKYGRKKIIARKIGVCVFSSIALTLIPFICRWACISATYPLNGKNTLIQNIPLYQNFAINMTVGNYTALLIIAQVLAAVIIILMVLGLSAWRKNQIQTIFFAILILGVPLMLGVLGFEFARYFSIYPLYSLAW